MRFNLCQYRLKFQIYKKYFINLFGFTEKTNEIYKK